MQRCVLPDRFERLQNNLGFERREIEFAGGNPMIDRPVDVLEGVFERGREAVESVAIDADINVPVFLPAAHDSDERRRDRPRVAVDRERFARYSSLGDRCNEPAKYVKSATVGRDLPAVPEVIGESGSGPVAC